MAAHVSMHFLRHEERQVSCLAGHSLHVVVHELAGSQVLEELHQPHPGASSEQPHTSVAALQTAMELTFRLADSAATRHKGSIPRARPPPLRPLAGSSARDTRIENTAAGATTRESSGRHSAAAYRRLAGAAARRPTRCCRSERACGGEGGGWKTAAVLAAHSVSRMIAGAGDLGRRTGRSESYPRVSNHRCGPPSTPKRKRSKSYSNPRSCR